MKKAWLFLILIVTFVACAPSMRNGGELIGISERAWSEPAPFGMVLVEKGSFTMGESKPDSLWENGKDLSKEVSVDAFWMDETEITNAEYKQFVYWVRDSIVRERLADPAFGGNEEYKIEEDRYGEPVTPHLNWAKPIPWRNPTEDEAMAIESIYRTEPITGKKVLDVNQMNYRYEVFDHAMAAQRRYRLDPNKRNLNTDVAPKADEVIMISKDTAFINDNGEIVNRTITRRRESDYDFLHTRILNVYPDTTAWINDFDNAFNEPYMRLYFSHPGYSEYPVVGVSWEQATAFCAWRTDYLIQGYGMANSSYIQPYRLPTEAEWEYAARAGRNNTPYPWEDELPRAEGGCFYANFKPEQGDYSKDGNLISARVASYSPNEFGLYDMAGNVSEWTSSYYSESAQQYASDMNPNFQYDAAIEDPYMLKRKIVRGGSWKDVSRFVRADIRLWEYQNELRSYIGFRCVRSHVGFSRKR